MTRLIVVLRDVVGLTNYSSVFKVFLNALIENFNMQYNQRREDSVW